VLPLDARWFAAPPVYEALAREINKYDVPVAVVIEHESDPFGVRYVVTGFLELLDAVRVPVLLLRSDVSALGALCHGAHAAAIGTTSALRHLYPTYPTTADRCGRERPPSSHRCSPITDSTPASASSPRRPTSSTCGNVTARSVPGPPRTSWPERATTRRTRRRTNTPCTHSSIYTTNSPWLALGKRSSAPGTKPAATRYSFTATSPRPRPAGACRPTCAAGSPPPATPIRGDIPHQIPEREQFPTPTVQDTAPDHARSTDI
jgi:hypothetical protein